MAKKGGEDIRDPGKKKKGASKRNDAGEKAREDSIIKLPNRGSNAK